MDVVHRLVAAIRHQFNFVHFKTGFRHVFQNVSKTAAIIHRARIFIGIDHFAAELITGQRQIDLFEFRITFGMPVLRMINRFGISGDAGAVEGDGKRATEPFLFIGGLSSLLSGVAKHSIEP